MLQQRQLMRLQCIRDYMQNEGLDAFLIRQTVNIAWATDFEEVFDEEQAHALLVTGAGVYLHTDSRYREAASKAAGGSEVHVDVSSTSHVAWLAARLLADDTLLTEGPITVGLEDTMSIREYLALQKELAKADLAEQGSAAYVKLHPTQDAVIAMRAVKDEREVQAMKAAQAITDACFAHIVDYIKPGMTESQIQQEMDRFMMANGADGLAFPTIVATGPHAASPHAQPNETVVRPGDCIVMDFGATYRGFCSDMTRCVFVGEPSQQLKDAYATLRRANEECEGLIKEGVTGKQAHDHAEQVLADGGYLGKMGHSLGHGVGMEIHEQPLLSPRNGKPLVSGNVVTVEPGIYIPGNFGMRLEDFGVVTETGYQVFTQSTHDMVIIPCS